MGRTVSQSVLVNSRILRMPSVSEMTGLSRSSIYRLVQESDFPKPISIGARAVGWPEKSIAEWLASRETSTNQGVPKRTATSDATSDL